MLKFLKTKTIQDTAVVTGGMVLSTLLATVSIFLMARWVGPAQFGLYVASLAIAVIAIDSLELAISNTIVNFGAKNNRESLGLIKYGFFLKLFLGLILGLLLLALRVPLAALINSQLDQPLLVAALFIPVVFLQRFPRSVLQSQKRFWADSSLEVSTSFFRLLLIIWLYLSGRLTAVTGLWAYLGGAAAALVIGCGLISWRFLAAPVDQAIRRRFFGFQKWLTAGFILAAIHGRIDSTIVLKLAGPDMTGFYQAAYRFFMPAMQLASALSLVFAPRFASFSTKKEARVYLGKAAKLTALLGAGVLLIIPLAPWLVGLIFGSAYADAVLPARILSLGFAWFVASAPFTAYLIYSANRTKTFAAINLVQLLLLVSLDYWLIPRLGANGAAMAASSTLLIINALIIWSALKK